MTTEEAVAAANDILARRVGQEVITVLTDNPNDCRQTIHAFKKLGCKVKVENDGNVLRITRRPS